MARRLRLRSSRRRKTGSIAKRTREGSNPNLEPIPIDDELILEDEPEIISEEVNEVSEIPDEPVEVTKKPQKTKAKKSSIATSKRKKKRSSRGSSGRMASVAKKEKEEVSDIDDKSSNRRGRVSRREKSVSGKSKKAREPQKKKFDPMSLVMPVILLVIIGGAAAYFPMQKNKLYGALGSGGNIAFDAAVELSKKPSELNKLIAIAANGGKGAMAASAAIANIARQGYVTETVNQITAKMASSPNIVARSAFAAALAGTRKEAGEIKAAEFMTDPAVEVRLALIKAFANAKSTPAAEALGLALGDEDPTNSAMAMAILSAWSGIDSRQDNCAAAVRVAFKQTDAAKIAAAELAVKLGSRISGKDVLPLLDNPSEEVRLAALNLMAVRSSMVMLEDEAFIGKIASMLKRTTQSPKVKIAALEVVHNANITTVLDEVAELLISDVETPVQKAAAKALGIMNDNPLAWSKLCDAMKAKMTTPELELECLAAIDALGPAGSEALIATSPTLLEYITNEDRKLAGAAIKALKSLSGSTVDYSIEAWPKYIKRRIYEMKSIVALRKEFKKMRDTIAADASKTEEVLKQLNDVGADFNTMVIDRAHKDDRKEAKALIQEMKDYRKRIRK